MAVKFTNNAKTTLASSLTNVATSASVVDGSVFPTLGAGEYFYCTFDDGSNNEIVKVTARSGNTLTIVRGVDNTTARAFSSGDAAELRATAGLLTDIQENIAAKSANQTVYNTTTASSATSYDIGIDPSVEANAMVFLNGVMQHHDTFSFSGSTLTFDTAPANGVALEVIVDNLINLQSSNLTVDTFTAADVGGNPQTDFTLSDSPAAETNLIVFVDGVFQDQDAYTISSNVLTMTDGVIADRVVTVYVINPVNIGTPSDGTVTSAKLSGNITMPGSLTVTSYDVAFDSPTFVVDNANSRVGIGTASPSTLLDIVGDVKMSADLTVDTNTLYVDSTNNKVGVGTSSPSRKFVVKDTTTAHIKLTESGLGESVTDGLDMVIDYTGTGYLINRESASLHLGTSNTNRLSIDSSGNLFLNTTSAMDACFVQLTDHSNGEAFLGISSKDDNNVGIRFGVGTTRKWVNYRDTSNNLIWYDNAASQERMRLLSSGGLTFNGDTAAANALDDYEEGTWTPALVFSGLSLSSYNTQQGYYTKIGRYVFCNLYIAFSGANLSGSSTGGHGMYISGLPFTSASFLQWVGNPTAVGRLESYEGTNGSTDHNQLYQFISSSSSNLALGVNKHPQNPDTTDFLQALSEDSFANIVGQAVLFEYRASFSYIV